MMYSNTKSHGGNFAHVIDTNFKLAKNVTIASGYTSLDMVHKYTDSFVRIANNGGESRLLLGMAFYGGLGEKKLKALLSLNEKLLESNGSSGVYISYDRPFHGKIYHFHDECDSKMYVGSSNFSLSGLEKNIECTIPVTCAHQKQSLQKFLDMLHSPDYTRTLNNVEIPLLGQPKKYTKRERKLEELWATLKHHSITPTTLVGCPRFVVPLAIMAKNEKSSLNTYFGRGRLNRATGKVTLRQWYEIDIIVRKPVRDRAGDSYPRGKFLAFTDDGLIIPMETQGEYNLWKNMRSLDNLGILGKWLKGKLEKKGCLQKYEFITPEILEEYGNTDLIFYKFGHEKYYMEF